MATAPIPEVCWIHDGVHVRESPIEDLGLFALVPLPEGTVVARLGGRLVPRGELLQMFAAAAADPNHPYVDCISIEEGVDLLIPPGQPIHFANHSCDPNLWHIDAFTLAARRDIREGEELTVDYATHSDDPEFVMECRCGASLCRGRVSGSDWQLRDLQNRYGEHWVPVLRERIRLQDAGS